MNIQHCSTLKTWTHFPTNVQEHVILNCKSDFIKFLAECLFNLLKGNIAGPSKSTLQPYAMVLKKINDLLGVSRIEDPSSHDVKYKNIRHVILELRIILSNKRGRDLLLYLQPFIEPVFCQSEQQTTNNIDIRSISPPLPFDDQKAIVDPSDVRNL